MPTCASGTSRPKSASADPLSRGGRLAILLYAVGAVAYALDRLTKLLAENHLADRPPVRIIPGVLDLRYTTNPGGAFGLFPGQPWLFFAATVVVCLAIVLFASPKLTSPATAVGLGLILGGALGNLTDRIIRGPGVSGRVVDFIDLQIWPVFNVADSAIVVGAALVLLTGVRQPRTHG
jgi:signal peptidase II